MVGASQVNFKVLFSFFLFLPPFSKDGFAQQLISMFRPYLKKMKAKTAILPFVICDLYIRERDIQLQFHSSRRQFEGKKQNRKRRRRGLITCFLPPLLPHSLNPCPVLPPNHQEHGGGGRGHLQAAVPYSREGLRPTQRLPVWSPPPRGAASCTPPRRPRGEPQRHTHHVRPVHEEALFWHNLPGHGRQEPG